MAEGWPSGENADEALERLVKEYQGTLLRFCYAELHDAALAEDAVQETFLKVYKNWSSFRGESGEQTWLMRIAVNTCRDFLRSAWFRHTDRRITPEMLPLHAAQATDEQEELALAIANLPRKYREAILLYYYQDMTVEETAGVLGLAQSSVSNRLKKGRETLRKMLERGDS